MNGASTTSMTKNGLRPRSYAAWKLLKYTYGIVPIVAGLDKFFNILTNWSAYANPAIAKAVSLEPATFMYIVGVIEIIAGILVLSKATKFGAYLVALWLLIIAGDLVSMGVYYDVAVRDAVMAIGAIALGLLSHDVGCYDDNCGYTR